MEKEKLDLCGTYLKAFGDIFANVKTASDKPTLDFIKKQNSFIVSSVFTKKIWKKVGGYDEKMKDGMEDWDFWIKLAKNSNSMSTITKFLFHYRRHGKSMFDSTKLKTQKILNYMKIKQRL